MDDKKKSSLSKRVIEFVTTLPSLFRLIDHFFTLIKYDANLAKRSLITLLLLYLIIGSLLTTIWLSILGMLLVYFISLNLSWLASLSIILILNLLLLVIVGLSILIVKNNVLFPKTRQLLQNILKN